MSRRVVLRPVPSPVAAGLLWYRGVRCPGCFGTHFHVGRVTAECAGCGAPLIIPSAAIANRAADLSQEI
jgi:ribosomal protein S27E